MRSALYQLVGTNLRTKPNKIRVYLYPLGIQVQQKTYPVTALCRVMQVSTSAYYDWLKTPKDRDKEQQDRKIAETAKQVFVDNKQCFGSRRLADRLQKQGFAVRCFKTRRIMRDLKLQVFHQGNERGIVQAIVAE